VIVIVSAPRFVAALVIGNDALDLTDTVDIRIVPLHVHVPCPCP
jgi:hypothetical protein